MGEKDKLKYTIILHEVRTVLELSLAEYCVADCIYHLSHNPNSDVIGWCYASKEKLGNFLNLSRQSIHTIIGTLVEKGLIEKNSETKYLRTTQSWYDNVILNRQGVKKLYTEESRNVTQDSKETLHNNNIDNNKDIDVILISFSKNIKEARNTQPTRKAIAGALKDFNVDDLCKIVENRANDKWFIDNNAKRGALWFFSSKARLHRWFDEIEVEEEKAQLPDVQYCSDCNVAHEVGKHSAQLGA